MTPEQHAAKIATQVMQDILSKYAKGQIEHGGKLWERDLLEEAYAEAIDMAIYLRTELDKRNLQSSN